MWYSKNSYYKTPKTTTGFDSKFEAGKAQDLDFMVKAGEIQGYEKQVIINLIVNDYKICDYVMDFVVTHNDGSQEWIETKGFATPIWRMKWKLLESLYGDRADIKLTVEFQGKGRTPKPKKWKSGLQF